MLGTITKAGKVLDLFTTDEAEWGVCEVAERLGMPKSSAHGLLSTLTGIGLVRNVAGRYRLGWRIAELNRTLYESTGLVNGADIMMRQLAEQIGAVVELVALRQHQVVVLDRVVGPLMVANDNPAQQWDTANSACGKVLLAHIGSRALSRFLDETSDESVMPMPHLRADLSAIRMRGLAYGTEDRAGLCSVAAPIRDADGAVHMALCLTLPALSFRRDRELLGKSLQRAAARITKHVRTAAQPSAVGARIV